MMQFFFIWILSNPLKKVQLFYKILRSRLPVFLQRRYGTRTLAEKEEATLQWGAPWNPVEPIEAMFFKPEELYIQAVIAGVPHTQTQLLDQALDKIKKKGLFIQTIITWNARPPHQFLCSH